MQKNYVYNVAMDTPITSTILFNIVLLFVGVGLFLRPVIWQRLALAAAFLLLIFTGLYYANFILIIWGVVLLIVNGFALVRFYLDEHRVKIPNKLTGIYDEVFSSMNPKEFLKIWKLGKTDRKKNHLVTMEGQDVDKLYFIIDGTVLIYKDSIAVKKVGPMSFIGEMSFWTNSTASADVKTDGETLFMIWEVKVLHALEKMDMELYMKFKNIIGNDLIGKASDSLRARQF